MCHKSVANEPTKLVHCVKGVVFDNLILAFDRSRSYEKPTHQSLVKLCGELIAFTKKHDLKELAIEYPESYSQEDWRRFYHIMNDNIVNSSITISVYKDRTCRPKND